MSDKTVLTDDRIVSLLDQERMKWVGSPPTYEFATAFARAIERAVLAAATPGAGRLERLGFAVERAAMHLPKDWELLIKVEKGAGTVEVRSPDGDEIGVGGGGDEFADKIHAHIDYAIASVSEQKGDV